MPDELNQLNSELSVLALNKEDGFNYRSRREDDWNENYTLARDKVTVNRLEQRQAVNIPLMKQTVRTLLKDVDDMPNIYFENLDNDKEKEIFQNEYWKWTLDANNSEIQDIVDKRQEFYFGRTFDQWQIVDGKIKWTVEDPQDLLVSRYTDPTDLNSSRFLIHTHIYKSLSELEKNEKYDKTAIAELKKFYATQQGLIKATTTQDMMAKKNVKMQEMGVPDVESPILGETYVELSLHFLYRNIDGEDKIWLYVEADDQQILMKESLDVVIGKTSDDWWKNHYPYHSWADDMERQDFWSDGIADVIRTPNKVLNAWFSQLVENRTLRNFNMQYYNSRLENFNPGNYDPIPFAWFPIPVPDGMRISDMVQPIPVADLSESLDEINFLIGIVEKATGASATQQGNITERKVTLGEVQLALGEAKERIKGMAKFYVPVWKQRAMTFLKLIEAGGDKLDAVKIHKKGKNSGDIYTREITVDDWRTKSGYNVRIWSKEEKDTNDTNTLQKLNAVKTLMPDNQKLDEIYKRKLLDFAGLSPAEISDVISYEEQKNEQMMLGQPGMPTVQPTMPAMLVKPPVQAVA